MQTGLPPLRATGAAIGLQQLKAWPSQAQPHKHICSTLQNMHKVCIVHSNPMQCCNVAVCHRLLKRTAAQQEHDPSHKLRLDKVLSSACRYVLATVLVASRPSSGPRLLGGLASVLLSFCLAAHTKTPAKVGILDVCKFECIQGSGNPHWSPLECNHSLRGTGQPSSCSTRPGWQSCVPASQDLGTDHQAPCKSNHAL